MDCNNILLVRVPAQEAVDGRELRDYILESLAKGVLVLTEDAACEVMELPRLGGVEVEAAEAPAPEAPVPPPLRALRDRDVSALGRNAAEKREIMARLKAYRETHRLGCWADVAKASGGKLTDDQLRDMCNGAALLPVAQWRLAAKALDKLEGKANG